MSQSRDRLSRPVNYGASFSRRRSQINDVILVDQENDPNLLGSPVERTTAVETVRAPVGLGFAPGRGISGGSLRTPGSFGNGRGRNLSRESTPPWRHRRGRGRRRGSVLPSWYPRTPLGDITAVVRAIERRRASQREIDHEGQQIETPAPSDPGVFDHQTSSSALLEHRLHSVSMESSNPTDGTGTKPSSSLGKVPKILTDITNQIAGESELLTPQKKLLNSVDTVEKVVMEELHNLKRTPTAKKAEREKRVRTLMSMR